jgi:hypothetical protein
LLSGGGDYVSQYGALFKSALVVVRNTLGSSENPFQGNTTHSVAVFTIVALWIFILVAGLIYFRRWDIRDHLILLYSPDEKAVRNKSNAVASMAHLSEVRSYLDNVST